MNSSNTSDIENKLENVSQSIAKISDLIKEISDKRDHEDTIKEIFEGQKALFNYDFNIFNYISQKISNYLTFILITEGIIAVFISYIINSQGVNVQTLYLIIPLLGSGVSLTISGILIVYLMKPRKILLPGFTSDLKSSKKGAFYASELEKIKEVRRDNKILLEKTASIFDYINYFILISIFLLIVTSIFKIYIFFNSLFSN